MNQRKISLLFCLVIVLFLQTFAFAAGKHALLIGISDYGGLDSLAGPKNDLRIVEGMLRERFDFQDGDFMILRDRAATHTGIERAFQTLAERVQPDDFVYIQYSGHGSQMKDLNGDEPSGLDQTWVSYGARMGAGEGKDNYDVLDDEINAWLAALYDKTHYVVFVSDSCHSGTVSRGDAVNRMMGKDEREHPLGALAYSKPEKYYGIHIGSARNFESAIETRRRDGRSYGVFSWYWVQALQQARAGETWNDVFKRTYAQVTAERGTWQRPQMEGERNRQVINRDFAPLKPTIPVVEIDNDLVTIQAGYLSGVTQDSVYRLYDPQQQKPELSPTLTITRVEAFVSQGKAAGRFERGDLVVEETHVYRFEPFKVYIDVGEDKENDKPVLEAIHAAFQPVEEGILLMPGYELTGNPKQADLRLHVLRPKQENDQYVYESSEDLLPKSFPEQPPEVWVLSPEQRLLNENLRIRFGDLDRGVEKLQNNLNKLARIRELKALKSNYSGTPPVEVQTYLLSPVDSCPKGDECMMLPQGLGLHRKTGPYSLQEMQKHTITRYDILTFTFQNTSEHDYFCYLINISPDGAIASIFPDPEERNEHARVEAGKTRELINETALYAEFVGEETIKFVASHYPIDVILFQQGRFEREMVTNPVEHVLVNAVHGFRGPISLRNDEWATDQVGFEVK